LKALLKWIERRADHYPAIRLFAVGAILDITAQPNSLPCAAANSATKR
jgi:hypothetical protein